MKQIKIPGILGGMGPEATVYFMMKVMRQSRAQFDQDHIRMLVDHNPRVPNRHDAIKGSGEDVGSCLAEMASGLEKAGADFIVLVCNTAHAFQPEIQNAIAVPFVSIVDQVINEMNRRFSENKVVGVMAAEGCLHANLYQDALAQAGYEYLIWDDDELKRFMVLVFKVKAGDVSAQIQQELLLLANVLIQRGAEVLIAGCTEISLVLNDKMLPNPILFSTDILAESVINLSTGKD